MTVSTSGNTTQMQGLSVIDDLNGLIHGKGGVHKIAPALDIVEQIAMLIARLFPSTAAVAGGVGLAAEIGKEATQDQPATTQTPTA